MPTTPDQQTPENRFLWQRNVADRYKSVSTEDIKEDLRKKALPCAVLAQNIERDFNLGSMMRAANFFGIHNFYYYGSKRIDRRSTVGVMHYMNIINIKSIDDIKKLKEKYVFVGVENNIEKTIPMNKFIYPYNSLLCFGEEQMGMDNSIKDLCDSFIEIPGRGSVRSLNVGAAAAIVMNDYISKTQ